MYILVWYTSPEVYSCHCDSRTSV